jgi:flagellin
MTLRINYNLSSLLSHQSLRNVDRLMTSSIARLSSGERIQRAGDDPASMVLSQKLRHHLAGINQATRNSEEGVTMVQTAEGAMDEISQLLTRIRTLAVQAANSGVQDPASLQAIQEDLNAAISSITRTATDTSFGSLPLLQGSLANNTMASTSLTTVSAITHDMTQLPGGIQNDSVLTTTVAAPTTLGHSNVNVTFTGLVSPLPGTTALEGLDQNGTTLDAVTGKNLTVTGPTGTHTITFAAGATINDLVSQVNAFTSQTGVRASYDANTGGLLMESTSYGNSAFAVASQDMTVGASNIGIGDDNTTAATNSSNVTLTGLVSPLPGTTPIEGLAQNGTTLDAVTGKTITLNGPTGSSTITLAAGATINDLVTQVNNLNSQTGLLASYDANTGALSIASSPSSNNTFSITSMDMTTLLSGVGLFDSDTTTVANTTVTQANTLVTPVANQTVQFSYVDAAGTTRSLTLTQDPASEDGLTFTNVAGGPEAVAPFTSFGPGAFSVTFVDTSAGTVGSNITIPVGSYTATRLSTTFIQTGAKANQITLLDIPDMRAGALGHTANLASTGLASLQDLTTTNAITSGNATNAILLLDAAIKEVTEARGRAGAIQANALESGIENLRVTFENLTSADSRLRDTDFAAESAAYARHNIIYQSATAMLAQANQLPQTLMQMLRQ